MADEDADLRRAYRAIADPAGHVAEAEWEALATGEIAPADRERVAEHVIRCRECADAWKVLAEVSREGAGDGLVRPGPGRAPGRWRLPLLAAAAVIAVVAVLPRETVAPPGDAVMRSGEDEGSWLANPTGTLLVSPTRFSWPPVAGARSYALRLYTSAGDVRWQTRVAAAQLDRREPAPDERSGPGGPAPEVTVDAGDLTLEPGRYYWEIEAELAEGGHWTGPLVAFEIRP